MAVGNSFGVIKTDAPAVVSIYSIGGIVTGHLIDCDAGAAVQPALRRKP